MPGFFNTLFSNILGSSAPKEEIPDDGGLAEFAKNLAQELEEEAKSGKKRASVSADDVLKTQQGSHGAKAYLLDISDFQKAIAKELRDSVAPVSEAILKARCGGKGTGYMNVKNLYIFNCHRQDPVEEYNAALDIIDVIGDRLLGERYTAGEKMKVPVAAVVPDELFTTKGGFDFTKAEKTIEWVRNSNTHGPADVNWETGDVNIAAGAPNWQPNTITPMREQKKEWQEQKHIPANKPKAEWQNITPAPKKTAEKQWTELKIEKSDEDTTEEVKVINQHIKEDVIDLKSDGLLPPIQGETAPFRVHKIEATDLKQLGTVILAFRPSWFAPKELINTYAGCAYRKTSNTIFTGEQIYPEDRDPDTIIKIDHALANQAAHHLKQTLQLDQKIIILPFHFISLSAPNSPLKDLLELDENIRKSIWIEIVGLGSNASPNRISSVISTYQSQVGAMGLRFDLGEVSRAMVERSKANFLSCDVEASTLHGLQMRGLEQDLPDLYNMAKACRMDICTWGLRNRQDLMLAIQEGSTLINGHALAKEMKKPGKIIPVSVKKLVSR